METIFEGGDEDAASLVTGYTGLLDDSKSCEQSLNGIAVISCRNTEERVKRNVDSRGIARTQSRDKGGRQRDKQLAAVTCTGSRHRFGNGTARNRSVPVHDLLKLCFTHRGRWMAQFPTAQKIAHTY